MKNRIIGRTFKEIYTTEYYRLEIVDKGYYKYVLSYFYSIVVVLGILFSFEFSGFVKLVICSISFFICRAVFLSIFSPIVSERFMQIDEIKIAFSPGCSNTFGVNALSWKSIKEIEKTNYNFRVAKYSIGNTSTFYKFTMKRGKMVEIICFDILNLELEIQKYALHNNIRIRF